MPFNSLFSLSLACSFYTPLALAAHHVHPTVDVAVIGGGFSGLVAAKTLHAANKSVVVLEARDRVGGRVFDTHFPDGTATYLGAQFVGPAQTNMVALAKELDVALVPTFNTGSTVLYINSTRVKFSPESSATGDLPIDAASLEQVAATEMLLNELATELDPAAPWNHTKANEWDSQTFASWLDSKLLSPSARFVFNLATTTGFSEEPGVVSFLSALVSIGTARNETGSGSLNGITSAIDGAEAMFCRDGCQSVAIKIASLLGPDRVRLNAAVRTIRRTQHGYEVETGNSTVIVKKVIIAMSPVMAGRIHYEPPLPAGRDQLSQRMPMGSVAKVIAKYETPFWRADGLNGQAFSNLGFAVSTYDISPQDASSGILLGFVAADQARSLDEKSKAEIEDLVKKDFVNYFGPKANNATDWIIQQWDEEVYSRGGYNSNYLPGTLTKYGKFVTEPFEGIHFAGVETARFWRGYMDGAISGGERAANEVLDTFVAN